VFAEVSPGIPDGLRLDIDGNLWTSAGDGVHCFSPEGALLGKINVPEIVANLTFGGQKKNRLFLTATTSIYSIFTTTRGRPGPLIKSESASQLVRHSCRLQLVEY
jgi:gluconolactonase